VTLREETEWIETVETGWNSVVGVDREAFIAALERPRPRARPPIFGDGRAGKRIANLLADYFS
jgi:UDP-N-acetylglucosamine 2-epimerase